MDLLAAIIAGYLLGSVPFAVLVSRLFGLTDPRRTGSGNPGATNVLRSGSKTAAALTLLGDAAKGWLAMKGAALLGASELIIAIAGVAAFVGHVAPFTLGFKGGKGVATALGVMLGFSPTLGGMAAGTWLAVALLTRYSSLSSLVAAICAPFYTWWLFERLTVAGPVALMSLVLVLRHHENIRKLMSGEESRIGARRSS